MIVGIFGIKAKKNLKWNPKVNLKKLIKILIDDKLKK